MAFIVEFVRGNPEQDRVQTCNISTFAWNKLLPVAERYGWKTAGCVFYSHRGSTEPHWEQPTDYHWDEWRYCKRIAAEEARNLAAALRLAIAAGITQSDGPTLISDSGFVDSGVAVSARQLAACAERGGFIFAVDD
jgi:hypothetical protein